MVQKLIWLVLVSVLSAAPPVAADDAEDREAILFELDNLTQTRFLSNSQANIASPELLLDLYEQRDFLPAWNDQRQINELISAIRATEADGLDPSDYHLEQIDFAYSELLAGRLATSEEWATQDLILTDSLARLGYHQFFGKVNPYTLDPNWNFRREINDLDPVTAVQNAIDSPSLTDYLATAFPRGWLYRALQAALAEYREIAARGGWPVVPEGPTLRPGATDGRLPVLARRLIVSGDLAPIDDIDGLTEYDDTLQEGVRHFQDRHGVDVDAIIGPATLRTLNVPVAQRIRQLEISLERARWVLDDLEDDFVLVNVAGFRAYVLRDREVVWETKVQVGSEFHQSPIFRDEIKYIVLNPTWTVPYSIATKEILPQIKSNPNYFASRDFDLKTGGGKLIDPSSVDWTTVSTRNFPYWLVQRPGPNNALGRVKFMFPNEHAVYLHDTPSKYLFSRAERAFSHGCIRVENPFDFAEQLLGNDGWTQERFQEVLDGGETTNVMLSTPLPVLLMYWTAVADTDGIVHFYNDVYSRDGKVAAALDEPFRLDLPGR
jgi:murein L,D-transpeptidase YcbB/YkuD